MGNLGGFLLFYNLVLALTTLLLLGILAGCASPTLHKNIEFGTRFIDLVDDIYFGDLI